MRQTSPEAEAAVSGRDICMWEDVSGWKHWKAEAVQVLHVEKQMHNKCFKVWKC